MGQVKGRRAANSLSSSRWRRFSGFNVRGVMAFTCIWPWGSFTRIWPQERKAGGRWWRSKSSCRTLAHVAGPPPGQTWCNICVSQQLTPRGPDSQHNKGFLFFFSLRSKGQEMIEWLITPIEAFNRNKRRLDTRGRKMEIAEVMDPPGPSVFLKGGQSCDNGTSSVTVYIEVMN